MFKLTPIDIAKFWMQVKEGEYCDILFSNGKWIGKCWNWNGSLTKSGYGRFFIHRKSFRAHRVAYYLYNSKISKDKYICHICDNTTCVNPKHLFEGSAKENSQDMSKKKRGSKGGNWKNRSSKYIGVLFRKDNNKWRARYMIDGKNFYVGQYDTELEAAKAYDEEVKHLKLERPLNFPT